MGVRENQFEGNSNKNEPMHGGSQNPRNQPTNIGNNLVGGENQFVMSSFKNVPLHGGAQHPPSNPQPLPKISKCQNETNEHSVALQNSTHPKPNPSKQSPQHHNGAHMKLKEHTAAKLKGHALEWASTEIACKNPWQQAIHVRSKIYQCWWCHSNEHEPPTVGHKIPKTKPHAGTNSRKQVRGPRTRPESIPWHGKDPPLRTPPRTKSKQLHQGIPSETKKHTESQNLFF